MYKTKKEVDAHVRTALAKIRTETEVSENKNYFLVKIIYNLLKFKDFFLKTNVTAKRIIIIFYIIKYFIF